MHELCRGSQGMTMEAAIALRSALLGVKVMHDKRLVYRDLKPANIGLLRGGSVLLDVGTFRQIPANGLLPSTPGTVGTIGYLAPELELEAYDLSIDIWAMGVILYQLTYDCHPWTFSINPWRDDKDNVALRDSFRKKYENAIARMERDYKTAFASPTQGYIHREYYMPQRSKGFRRLMKKNPWQLEVSLSIW
jgi:serine/threonine protein kinase